VADVLFPDAKANAAAHLLATYDTPETQDDIALLRKQVRNTEAAQSAQPLPCPGLFLHKMRVAAQTTEVAEL